MRVVPGPRPGYRRVRKGGHPPIVDVGANQSADALYNARDNGARVLRLVALVVVRLFVFLF